MLLYTSNYQIPPSPFTKPLLLVMLMFIALLLLVHCVVCAMVIYSPTHCLMQMVELYNKKTNGKEIEIICFFFLIKKHSHFVSFFFFIFLFKQKYFKDYLFLGCLITTLLLFLGTFKRFQHQQKYNHLLFVYASKKYRRKIYKYFCKCLHFRL